MALNDVSPFAPVDLLGGMVTNAIATNMAVKNYNFRTGIEITTKDANGAEVREVPAYLDYRFIGGMAAALAGQFTGNPMVRRVGHDVANGLLNSFVATETCRRAALERVSGAEWESKDGPMGGKNVAGQLSAGMQQSVPAGAQNYAYGW